MLKIGSLILDNWLIMAPMAGVSDLPFRLTARKMGAALVTTEMVSAKGLTLRQARTLEYLESDPSEKPLSVQIFGSAPDVMAEAARIVVDAGADIVDINMGCPVRKVVKTGAGGALLRDPAAAGRLVAAVRRACPVPLTVKVRAGWSPDRPQYMAVAAAVQEEGADALTVHPRYVSQGFSGCADWALIARVKEKATIPIIGNGDVFEPRSALEMKRRTGCDGVMIGRGAMGKPWIFRQILALEKGLALGDPGLEERRALILEHFRRLAVMMGSQRAAWKMRSSLLRYTKGLPRSAGFRGAVGRITDQDTLAACLDEYFAALGKGCGPTPEDASLGSVGGGAEPATHPVMSPLEEGY
jgi:nifR3 family TIM-barrel protein